MFLKVDNVLWQWRRNEFESGGAPVPSVRSESVGGGHRSTISRFWECFRDGQYSLVNFLFTVLLLARGASRAQTFVKVGGGTWPPCLMESAPLCAERMYSEKLFQATGPATQMPGCRVGEMSSFSTGYRLVTRVLHTHIFLVMTKHSVRHVILH